MAETARETTLLSIFNTIEAVMAQMQTLDKHPGVLTFLESAPTDLVQGRTLKEIVADDLMELHALVFKDVSADGRNADFYFQLMQHRHQAMVSRPDADMTLRYNADKKAETKQSAYIPMALRLTKDVPSMVQVYTYLQDSFEQLSGGFGQILFSNDAMVSYQAANDVVVSLQQSDDSGTKKNLAFIHTDDSKISKKLRSLLNEYASDFTIEAKDLDDNHGRDEDVKRLSRVLLQQKGASALLHGGEGIGKSTVVKALARNMAEGKGPGQMKNGSIFKLNLADMLFNGPSSVIDKKPQVKDVLLDILNNVADHNAKNPKEPVILYIEDFGNSTSALKENMTALRALIAHELSQNKDLHLIASATDQEIFLIKKQSPDVAAVFETLKLQELPADIAMIQLQRHAEKISNYHSVEITQDALDHIAAKTDRYMPNQFRPGKGIGILLSAVAESELNNESTLSIATIDNIIAEKTGLPLALIGGSASDRIENLGDTLSQRIFGQDEAVTKISKTIGLVNRNLHDPKKPLGVFYLMGSSGVGKSELAKSLSESLFVDEKALITVNLADFAEKHTVSRIVGSPPGYIGYGEETALEAVDKKPFSVVLFDEAEKAHPEVDNALMKIMDEGELTLLNGKKLNFRNCVLIFTSNLGATAAQNAADEIKEKASIGFTAPSREERESDASKAAAKERLQAAKDRLKPEFRNRATFIDMNDLTPDVVRTIALKKIDGVSASLRQNKLYAGLSVKLSDAAMDELMSVGFDAKNGARPMDRAIRDYVKVPLADWLKQNEADLAGETKTLTIDSVKDSFTVTATATAANQNKAGATQSASTRKPGGPTAQPA
ncbi:AAA family ATPase [Micavibrio aeruginosavorus]|uniref:ATPase associated with various cellular activities family protein n=1 Tax=Micavibrio aeruginosavorus (strain ARL-13) TaxID=856793 RepID=G2KQM1_MICAA|nr:AAA family ATPase [Micavibrio aeruginosavorus]AEP09949.1 ATPase associated with various cellular activities family protein [Micavibrio aeruginosavorus ARL-13]